MRGGARSKKSLPTFSNSQKEHYMSCTIAGVPRVRLTHAPKAKPIEATTKRITSKKSKAKSEDNTDLDYLKDY